MRGDGVELGAAGLEGGEAVEEAGLGGAGGVSVDGGAGGVGGERGRGGGGRGGGRGARGEGGRVRDEAVRGCGEERVVCGCAEGVEGGGEVGFGGEGEEEVGADCGGPGGGVGAVAITEDGVGGGEVEEVEAVRGAVGGGRWGGGGGEGGGRGKVGGVGEVVLGALDFGGVAALLGGDAGGEVDGDVVGLGG